MRIVVAEDMAMMSDELTRWCREHGHQVVAQTPGVKETLRACLRLRPDVLLLDVRLNDGDGLGVVEPLRRKSATRIIVVTAYSTAPFLQRLAQLRVDGFIDKGTQKCAALGDALAAMAAGKKWFSPNFREALNGAEQTPAKIKTLLTAREQEVLRLIGASYSDAEIAAQLGLSLRTVEWHRGNLLHKLNCENSVKLIAFANENGFVPGAN